MERSKGGVQMLLEKKIALVTGAGRGIGKAIAWGFAKEGADIVVNDLDLDNAEVTAAEIKTLGRRSLAIRADVVSEAEVSEMVERTIREWGGIDILVNNAGIGFPLMVEDMDKSEWDRIVDVNLGGTFNCSRAVIETMKKRGGGKIINISSMAARNMSNLGGANYTASKWGVLGFTRHLAYELGPFKINVNAICPGPTVTPLFERDITPEFLELTKKQVALKELLRPEDIADTAIFLASDRARMITGFTIDVDGGWSLSAQDWEAYVRKRKEVSAQRQQK